MKKRRMFFFMLGAICSSILLVGCGKKEKIEGFERIEILEGAIIKRDKGEFYNLNLREDKYVKNNNNSVVLEDTSKSQLIFENEKHFALYNGEKIEFTSENYSSLNLSSNGSYLAYMVYEEGYNLKILDLEEKLEKNLKSKVRVSGTFFDFINDNTLVYYGISEDNKNGIFMYDLKADKEELIYEIKEGYVEFLKVIGNDVIFLEQSDKGKKLEKISIEDKKSKIITDEITFIYDMVENKEGYFILGSGKEGANSLYRIDKNGRVERLVYDFPQKIDVEKGLSKISDKILFIGNSNNIDGSSVYEYKDNEIKLISEKEGIYEFVKKD
ncbi:MAG: hypothetical protein ACRC30_03315 [Clostridium sp.]